MTDIFDLIEDGCSPAEAVDYYAVDVEGITQKEWASTRGIQQASVSQNVIKAREKLF